MRPGASHLWAIPLVALTLLAPTVEACLSPYGFLDFEPQPLAAPGEDVEMAPVDVSASSVDDMNQRLVSYDGDLYALWVKETGTTEVSENVMCRVLSKGSWGDLWAVNNIVPEEGSFNDTNCRVAGFDALVHEGLLYVFWSTPYENFTHATDNDIVYRTFDGTSWGDVVDVQPEDDGAEQVQPTAVSTEGGILVAWTTNDPELTGGGGTEVEGTLLTGGPGGPVWLLSEQEDEVSDFIPQLVTVPGGGYLTWYTRKVLPVGPGGSMENVLWIHGRCFDGRTWSDVQRLNPQEWGESIWVSTLWDGERLCLAWQFTEAGVRTRRHHILYREWEGGALSPPVDLTGRYSGSSHGKPSVCIVEGQVRVYWHTDDDSITVGTTFDLVWRAREEGDHWGPIEVYQSDPQKDLLEIETAPHGDAMYASWLTNMTHESPGPEGIVTVWDVVVGPLYVPEDPAAGMSVTHKWKRSVEAWGPAERIQFLVERSGEPVTGCLLHVDVVDPEGEVEAVLEGSTGADGRLGFEHQFETVGTYGFNITVEGSNLGIIEMAVAPSPPGSRDELVLAVLIVVGSGVGSVATGYGLVRRRGVVRGRKVRRDVTPPKGPNLFWRWASNVLNYVVKNKWAQGFLQMPLFVLYVLAIYIGFFGSQDPTENFATMVGWTYYLAGILLLYAVFGRLWCYVEACGFVDTWAKNLRRGRGWLEWPVWLKNLWPGFFILLTGFWVEIVLSVDLYPWAVATFMLSILVINMAISSVFSKRTYCRYVCRDGVVEELIARYSILRIGVRNRVDTVPHGDTCIWTDEEKRPGFCSMCFSCVQNDSTVREATVEPALTTFAQDVYKPQAVHRDEATAAVVLMGISIPYMLVLTGLWWEGVADASSALIIPLAPSAVVALGAVLVAASAAVAHLAFTRWPGVLTTPRRALVAILVGVLLVQYFLAGLGGPVGRIIALRSTIVLACFVVPFMVVWSTEALVVRGTGDARGETAWRLLERYGLVFIPVFLGVLVARNLPLVGAWGWAVWDITVATFSEFPGGMANAGPQPFVDPSLHYILGVLALAVGVVVGAYAALQLSRRLYMEERNAMVAFSVHTAALVLFGCLFALILSLPPF